MGHRGGSEVGKEGSLGGVERVMKMGTTSSSSVKVEGQEGAEMEDVGARDSLLVGSGIQEVDRPGAKGGGQGGRDGGAGPG